MDAAARPFWNDGGPLLILPQASIPYWEGIDLPSHGRVVHAAFRWSAPDAAATDYDRACDAGADSVTKIDVGPSWGIVLGTAAAQSAQWLRLSGRDELFAVGIEALFGDDPERLPNLIESVPATAWRSLLSQAEIGAEGLLLSHAADRPAEVRELPAFAVQGDGELEAALIGDGLRCSISAGIYTVSACDLATPEGEYLTFVQFASCAPEQTK